MATAVNDVTGALITTKGKSTTNYGDNYDRIFRNKKADAPTPLPTATVQLKKGEHLVQLPEETLKQLGWGIGTALEVAVNDGKLILTRAK